MRTAKYLFFSLVCVSLALAQGSYSDQESDAIANMMQGGGFSGSGSMGQSAGESDIVKRMLMQERSKSGLVSQGAAISAVGKNGEIHRPTIADSASLFMTRDSLLMMPFEQDTLFYILSQDTVPIELLDQDTSIVERIARAPDPRKVIVRRRTPISREQVRGVERYEIQFFRNAPAALFGSVTNGVDGNYPIKPGDKLVLSLWGEVEKEYTFAVNNQGKVMVEGIGLNSVNNLSLSEAEEVLKQKLAKIYSGITRKQTFVNLRLESLSPVKIFLVGEVSKPGGYVFYGNTSIFQALYLAGGPNKLGSVRNIQVTRGDTNFTVDLYEYLMFGRKPEPSVLNDGDIVFLPRADVLAEAKGDLGRPAIYELKKGETVKDLMTFAGKVNPTAAQQRLVVKRIFANGKQDFIDLLTPQEYLEGKTTFPMQDGDVLLVNKSTEPTKDYVTIIGAVKYPGTYQFKPEMKAPDLVDVAGGILEDTYLGRIQVLRTVATGGFTMSSQPLNGGAVIPLAPRDTVIVYSLKDMYQPDSVTISGAVLKPGRYQFNPGMTAKDLILKAGGFLPNREIGVLRVEHVRKDSRGMEVERIKIQDNYEAETSGPIILMPWDHMEVPVDPNFHRPQKVKLAGAFKSPGEYSLLFPGEKLKSLIDRSGGFQEDAYLEGAQFFRNKDSIGQIGFSLAQTMDGSKRENVELQDGDSIYVPIPKLHIRVVGEVGYPANVLYKPGKSIAWYIIQAGGFRESSDRSHVMIRYANGSASTEYDAERDPDPGSTIIVPYKEPPEPVDWYKIASTIAALVTATATLLIAFKR